VARESSKAHWAAYWDELEDVDDTYSNEGRILAELLQTGTLKGKLAVEVGAGSGRDSVALKEAGAEVIVFDYVKESLEKIKQVTSSHGVDLMCVCADATRSPFADESVDIVFHQGLLEHFRDPLQLLDENRRILKPGGALLVDVPQRYHPYTLVKHVYILFGKWFAGWETEFSVGQLTKLLTSNGFDVNHIYGDWMVPNFLYRSIRYVLRRRGWITLPKYPRYWGPIERLSAAWREFFRKSRFAPHTYAVIGAVARKR
jgi:SAM-dependent methyltransferase